jgi:hypothetical protein
MFFKYLTLERAVLLALVVLFANRAWNYYDKIGETINSTGSKYWIHFSITLSLFMFFLGFLLCLEFI